MVSLKQRAYECDRAEHFRYNKRELGKWLACNDLPKGLDKSDRDIQMHFGILPKAYDYYLIMRKEWGGTPEISNICVMKKEDADRFEKDMNHVTQAHNITEIDRPFLTTIAKKNYGAITYEVQDAIL
jgi:hypothetical protein